MALSITEGVVSHIHKIKVSLCILMCLVLTLPSFSLLLSSLVNAAGESITGATNKTGLTDEYISLGSLQIVADGNPNIPVNISAPSGELTFTDTTGLTFETEEYGTNLLFSGNLNDVNAALTTLRFRTIQAGTVEVSISISQPGEVYFPGNGHLYEIVEAGEPITWEEADVLAGNRTKYGASGYLATITSQEENDYISPRLDGSGWFGASDAEDEGDWKWVRGPEADTSFWSGLGSNNGGVPVSERFSNWASGEPNDVGDEDCAQFYADGTGWNDLSCAFSTLDYYVVEYGDDESAPEVVSSSFNVTTTFPTGATIEIDECSELTDLADNSAVENRYDNIVLTDDIDCEGAEISPMHTDIDSYFGVMGFRGTFDGNGHTISNFVIDSEEDYVGLFAHADGATFQDITLAAVDITGVECVGALAGSARDTSVDEVHISATLTGVQRVGGIIGCYESMAADATLSNSSSEAEISVLGGEAGGLVGYTWTDNHTMTLADNQADSIVSTNAEWAWGFGGLVGRSEVVRSGTMVVEDNTTQGISVPISNATGGLLGQVYTSETGSTAQIVNNQVQNDVAGGDSVGGVLGYGEATYGSSILITDNQLTHNVSGDDRIGGLVGTVYAEGPNAATSFRISHSSASGTVEGDDYIGGIAGYISSDYGQEEILIQNSFATGNVTAQNGGAGGIAGRINTTSIVNSYATGNVVSVNEGDVGGLVGSAFDSLILRSYATGTATGENIEGEEADRIGGLVGQNGQSTIEKSYATGAVTGHSRVGGLTGANGGLIIDSYSRGSVTGTNNVGGLSGRCGRDIVNSYATGAVTGDSNAGGLVGYSDGCEAENSFWDSQTTTQGESAAGTAKTTAEMKQLATFTDTTTEGLDEAWNFANTWGIFSGINNGYPCLVWTAGGCLGSDDDEDGVSNDIEDAAPNDGDANGDNIPDSQQENVTSFVNTVTNTYATVALVSSCNVTEVATQAESAKTVQDAGYNYRTGLVNFSATCSESSTTVNLYFYGLGAGDSLLRKHNPNTNAYFTVEDAAITSQTIGGQQAVVASYTIEDNGPLDLDPASGQIADPVGLASLVVGAPNTGLGSRRTD